MFPDTKIQQAVNKGQNKVTTVPLTDPDVPYETLVKQFVGEVRSSLSTLTGEIAARNNTITENDGYVYSDLLDRMLDIPIGHDFTSVNWLRRTVEIHRTQSMGKGFSVTSTYNAVDINTTDDPNEQQRLVIENQKRKDFAEQRAKLCNAIMTDNGGKALWANMAEMASAVGDSIMKAWYDESSGKYKTELVEATENCYALWTKDNFREWDMFAYVFQISKQEAKRLYGVGENVATSPLGTPLAILAQTNVYNYISTQPMVTIMEVTGKVQGWCSRNGVLSRCQLGDETEMNAVIVGNEVYQLIDEVKYIPKYYIFPNKRVRRRAWGLPDVTKAAINLNLTYIETFSDWRTLASKVNFPKWKAFGFAPGTQIPKPKARTVEALPLVPGQDLQPLQMPNSAGLGEMDFQRQLQEIASEFVREVGIGRILFDSPDAPSNSNQASLTSMKSISDITSSKQQLWQPIIVRVFEDALKTVAMFDDTIKSITTDDEEEWYLRVEWPSMLNQDDPVYQTMHLNRFNAGLLSVQSYMEAMGDSKEELDRIREEMEDKVTAAIHGHQLPMMAEYKILPPFSQMPPKVNVNLRGDLTPNQEGDIAAERGIVTPDSPFPNTVGPQGYQGLNSTDNVVNQGMIQGQQPGPMAVQKDAQGNTVQALLQPGGPGAAAPGSGTGGQGQPGNGSGGQPQPMVATQANNIPGSQPMSQPGSGAPAASASGTLKKHNQHKGH